MTLMLRKYTVLVVDDVNAIRVQVKDLLKQMGVENVLSVSSAEEAKLQLEMQACHVIVADWHMQPTSGIDLLRYVRSHPEKKNMPFIMLTAESTRDYVIEAIKAGVDDYLVKPISLNKLHEKVVEVLKKRKVVVE